MSRLTLKSAREEILAKVAASTASRPAPTPADIERPQDTGIGRAEPIKRPGQEAPAELIKQLETELTRVGACFHIASDSIAACDYIRGLLAKDGRQNPVVAWRDPIIHELGIVDALAEAGAQLFLDDDPGTPDEFTARSARAGIGISGVDYALADSGTLVVFSGSGRARSVSLLPPVHVAILKPEQIVSGLDDLFSVLGAESVDGNGLASAITFITGPSRTGDIEMTLVVGVHGPQQLHVILLATNPA